MIKEVYFVRHSKPLKVNNDKNIDSLQIQNEKQPLSIEGENIAREKLNIEELKDIKVMFSRRYDLYKFKHIEELENYLKEMVIVICSGKENTKKKSKIVEEIVHYVENNYYKNISLRELAENKYFVNYSYCSRLFSQETGMNFSKYLIQYRLKKAKTLLENKDMKISFIAFEVGYNDVSHFIQSFKKSYGLTPEEYRARKKIE